MKYKIAGTVILYNPLPEYIENIYSYIHQVDKLYVINNSEIPLAPIFYELKNKNAVFIENKGNLGIGTALNQGVQAAIRDDFDLLLTMDQDSFAESDMVRKLNEYFIKDDKVAIVSARQSEKKEIKNIKPLTVMTSGNLINLKILNSAGGFREDLFIDYVDHEVCLRLIAKGYKVLLCNDIYLNHNLGNETVRTLFGKKVHPSNYPPLRYYYQSRNRLYVYKAYKHLFPAFVKEDRWNFIKRVVKMLLYEKDRIEKLKYFIKGYMDYYKNIRGKYNP